MKKRTFTSLALIACITAISFAQTGERYIMEYDKHYVFRVVGEEHLVIAYYEGASNFIVEPYEEGNKNQLFQMDSFVDNEEAYMNISIVANDYTWDDHGRPAKPEPKPSKDQQDSWHAWDLELNEDGHIRFCHFLQRWMWTATWLPQYKGVFLFLSERDIAAMEYARCVVEGELDNTEYESLAGELFDFKIEVVSGTDNIQQGTMDAIKVIGQENSIHLYNVENQQIEIYSIDGKLLHQVRADGTYYKVDIADTGIYLVKTQGKTVKVAVK